MGSVNLKIDNVSYDVEGVNYNRIKGLEHNSLSFFINDSDLQIPFTRYTNVEIEIIDEDDNTISDTFLLQADEVDIFSFITKTTTHDISCIERVSKLEKSTNISRQFLANGVRTLRDIVVELRLTNPFVQDADLLTTRLYNLSSNLNVLDEHIAPDIIFNNLNHRECLIMVFDEAGAFPVLRANNGTDELDISFYNQKLNKVDLDDDTVFKSQDANINEYATNYDADASNMVNTTSTLGGAIFDPALDEFKGLRSDEGFFTSANAFLESELPKYRKVIIQQRVPTETLGTIVLFTTDYYVETGVFKTYIEDAIFPDNQLGFYKSNALIYDFKSRRIEGFFRQVGIFNQDTVIERIIKSALTRLFISQGDTLNDAADKALSEYVQQEFYELEFNLIYTPEFNARFRTERLPSDDVTKTGSKSYNQSANFVAPNRLLRSMFSTLQKKSNVKIATAVTVTDLSTLYELNYYTADNYILTEIQLLVNIYDYTVNYTWTKNDNKVSDRIEIDSKLELFSIASSDRQQKRNEYFREYIYADVVSFASEDVTALNDKGLDVILNTLEQNPTTSNDVAPLGAILFSSEIELNEDPETGVSDTLSGTQRIAKPIQSWGGLNCLNLYYEFDNATIAGDELIEINGKQTLRGFRYTDKNGELVNLDIDFAHGYTVDKDTYPLINTPITDVTVQLTDLVWYLNSSEIEALTYAVHILPVDSETIVFYPKFFENNFFVQFRNGVFPELFASRCSSRYDTYDDKVKDVIGTAGDWSVSNGTLLLDNNVSGESWIIADENDNVYMAVNQRKLDGSFRTHRGVVFARFKERIDTEEI